MFASGKACDKTPTLLLARASPLLTETYFKEGSLWILVKAGSRVKSPVQPVVTLEFSNCQDHGLVTKCQSDDCLKHG